MRLLILFTIVCAAHGRVLSKECDGVVMDNVYYDKTILLRGLDRPYMLNVDHDTDMLYFSYNVDKSDYKSARVNMKTKEMKVLEGISNGFSSAIDRVNKVIYIGTTDGIYAYNYETEETEYYGAKGSFIWTLMLTGDLLYYTVYPTQELYILANGASVKVPELQNSNVHNFLLENDGDMTFDNSSGLFVLKKGQQVAERYGKSFKLLSLRSLTLDQNKKMYACFDDGIYLVNKNLMATKKILDLYDAFGLTFDKDNNMIYSEATEIVKLTRNDNCKKK